LNVVLVLHHMLGNAKPQLSFQLAIILGRLCLLTGQRKVDLALTTK
jgi:hypothetical protein